VYSPLLAIFWVFKAIACKSAMTFKNGTGAALAKVQNIHQCGEPIVTKGAENAARIGSITNGPKEIQEKNRSVLSDLRQR
jgi:hypothetical protein